MDMLNALCILGGFTAGLVWGFHMGRVDSHVKQMTLVTRAMLARRAEQITPDPVTPAKPLTEDEQKQVEQTKAKHILPPSSTS